MKQSHLRISIAIFLLILGKSFFDLNLFAFFFSSNHSVNDIALVFGYAGIIGLIMVMLFNYLQRSFKFSIAIFYTYILLFGLLSIAYFDLVYTGLNKYLFYIVSSNISINILLVLLLRGLIMRMNKGNIKELEKATNISFNLGILIAASFVICYLNLSLNIKMDIANISFTTLSIIITSLLFLIILIKKDKTANSIIDSLQEIKANQNTFKLLKNKYYTTIFLVALFASFVMVFTYSLFIKVNVIYYNSPNKLLNIFSISAAIFSGISIVYELFLKEKAYYSFGVKIHLIALPLVIIIFTIIFLTNTFYLKITFGNEFFFFIPIIASLFFIFTHFAFVNIFYPVINSLYLPLKSDNQNDFYIRSSFFGFVIGIGIAAYVQINHLPKFNLINESGYIIINLVAVIILFFISRLLVYKNYKKALHKRLYLEEKVDITKSSFVNTTMQKIKDYSGITIVRIVNLLYLIDPVKSKNFFGNLALSDDLFTQRVGIISSIKLYLLDIYDEMKMISQSKYFPSSPNRDKVGQLINKLDELKIKIKKPYYIPQLSVSKKDIERVYGGLLALYAPKNEQKDILSRLVRDPKLPVTKNAIISSAGTKDPNTIKTVIEKLGIAELSNAAYSALVSIDNDLVYILDEAFYQTGQSEKVQIKIVRLLGDIGSETAVEFLLKKLNYTNQNIISGALEALSKCNLQLPEKKAMIIKHELEEVCKYLVWNTSLLIDAERNLVSEILVEAIKIEIEYNYETLFNLLALFYNPGSIELIRKNLRSRNYEKVSFALELASVILKDEIKPMILPLIRPMSNEERLKKMQLIFSTEKMTLEDILYDIIQRDFKWINPWTKACAIMEISTINTSENLPILLANMVNPDPMLAELSALYVFSKNKEKYYENKEIFGREYTNIISHTAINAIENSNKKINKGMPILKFEIIKYLKEINEFSNIPGEVLKYLTNAVSPLEFKAGEVIESIDNLDISNYHYIVYAGKVNLLINDIPVKSFGKNTFLSTLDLLIDYNAVVKLSAETDVQIYKIDPSEFADYLNFYDEIPFSIVENTSTKDISVYEQIIKNEREYQKAQVVFI